MSYWIYGHNRIIDAGEGEYSLWGRKEREYCKTRKVKVVKSENGFLYVSKAGFEGRIAKVLDALVPTAKAGDALFTHLGMAIPNLLK